MIFFKLIRKGVNLNIQRTSNVFVKQNLVNSYCNICLSSKVAENHYEILGISRSANNKEIKDAYLKLSKIHHPDKVMDNGFSAEKYIQVSFYHLSALLIVTHFNAVKLLNGFSIFSKLCIIVLLCSLFYK